MYRMTLEVRRVFKACHERGRNRTLMDFWLLETGPHRIDGKIQQRVNGNEPSLRRGENVILFGDYTPIQFQTVFQSMLTTPEGLRGYRESYGNEADIIRYASYGVPGVIEASHAYKVVGTRMSVKSRGFRPKDDTSVMDIADFGLKVAKIVRQQHEYCKRRVVDMEHRWEIGYE